MSDVDDDLKELLRDKADEMRLGQGIPQRVLRRSRRRRIVNTALAGSLALVIGVGAFVGARAAMNGGERAHGGPAGQVNTPIPTPSTTPTSGPSGPPAAIVVSEPSAGDKVTSPVHISGTADVFEAQVSYAISGASGNEIAGGAVAASCGSGCRGTFSINAAFHVSREQAGTIEVYESSAKDGSRIHVVDIAVTLEPGGTAPVLTGFDGIWPADTEAQLQQLQGNPSYADPVQTATAFAAQVAGWSPSDITPGTSSGSAQTYEVVLWNPKIHSPYDPAYALNVQLRKAGDVWIVRHADDGLFDLLTPSTRQDAVIGSSQQISGQFGQGVTPSAGWKVTAVLTPVGSTLSPSPKETTADIPISGSGFNGSIKVPATSGGDVELIVTVTDTNGNSLGLWARRLSVSA